MKTLASVALMACLLSAVPVDADVNTDVSFPYYTGPEFQALYEYAAANTLPNLDRTNTRQSVTGDASLDDRIWELALARGYRLRPSASGGIVSVDGVSMQESAAEAWLGLKEEAREAGMTFVVSSAYRSPASQRAHFNSKLAGTSDEAIEAALTWYSVPGTSKHHSGYALDFRYREGTFGGFRDTPDYAWLAADNFAVAKKHGFIPSYPDDGDSQGPNPEPWEFVWVGTDLIRCGIPLDIEASRYAAGHRSWLAAESWACPGSVTVADLDYMLKIWGRKLQAMLMA